MRLLSSSASLARRVAPRRSEFVVFCEARTGSYNLVSRLDSCADVVCHGEVFKKNRIELSDFHARRNPVKDIRARNLRPGEFLAGLRAINPFRHFGFKLFASHLGWAPGVVDYLAAADTRRIVLYRPPLEIYASGLRARQTGVWTSRNARAARAAEQRVRFSEESFEAFAAHFNRYAAMCRLLAALPSTFVIHYGQTNDPAAMNALLRFIGSRSVFEQTTSEYAKQYRGSLEAAFANWEELQARLPALTPLAEGPPPTVPAPAGAPVPV